VRCFFALLTIYAPGLDQGLPSQVVLRNVDNTSTRNSSG
jgi:hypothetical protein